MAVTPSTKRLSAEEYLALDLPERHTQLVNGEIVVNQPSWRHQEIATAVDTSSDTVLVYRRSSPSAREFDVSLELGRGDKLTSPLLAGLSIDLEELFDL